MKIQQSYWVRSLSYTLLEQFSAVIFGLGSVLLLLRVLPKDDFGIWALFLTVAAFIEVARNGLVQNALIKHLTSLNPDEPDFHRQYAQINTASAVINIGLTVMSIVLLIVFAALLSALWQAPQLKTMLYIYALSTTAMLPFSQFTFLQQANFNFKGVFWASFCRQGSFFVMVAAAYLLQAATLIHIAFFHAIAAGIGAAVSCGFAIKYMQFSQNVSAVWVKQLIRYGKYVFGTNLGAMLHKSIDKFMLGSLIGTGAVAIYDLATRINNLMEVPVTAAATVVFPQSTRSSAAGGQGGLKELYQKSVAAVLALLLPAILIVLLFPSWIIWIIGGSKYADTAPLLQITVLYSLFLPFARQFGTMFDAIGKPRINFYFVLFGTLLNILFNYFFIMRFGVMGAAYATLLVFVITFVFNQMLLAKELKLQTAHIFTQIWKYYQLLWRALAHRVMAQTTPPQPKTSSPQPKTQNHESTTI
ncbi:MAG TPA: flippase [Chitinophagales bacterium]|nr:flippase [Chitinophagales bacterium]HRK26617.1 flippase [Chitinophagales bacterium]